MGLEFKGKGFDRFLTSFGTKWSEESLNSKVGFSLFEFHLLLNRQPKPHAMYIFNLYAGIFLQKFSKP